MTPAPRPTVGVTVRRQRRVLGRKLTSANKRPVAQRTSAALAACAVSGCGRAGAPCSVPLPFTTCQNVHALPTRTDHAMSTKSHAAGAAKWSSIGARSPRCGRARRSGAARASGRSPRSSPRVAPSARRTSSPSSTQRCSLAPTQISPRSSTSSRSHPTCRHQSWSLPRGRRRRSARSRHDAAAAHARTGMRSAPASRL